jgi:hypothetical protein
MKQVSLSTKQLVNVSNLRWATGRPYLGFCTVSQSFKKMLAYALKKACGRFLLYLRWCKIDGILHIQVYLLCSTPLEHSKQYLVRV